MRCGGVIVLVCGWKAMKWEFCCGGRLWCSGLRLYSHYGFSRQVEEEEVSDAGWYRAAYPRLIKLACGLKNIDQVDGRLTNVYDGLVITDDHLISDMQMFKWLARAFVGSPSMQEAMKKTIGSAFTWPPPAGQRKPVTLDSLTTVCNFLNVSVQQRKSVRLTICPQVTQHHIWRAALEGVLKNVGCELRTVTVRPPAILMGEQILSSCLQFLADTTGPSEQETPLWMQLAPEKKADKPVQMRKWAEVLEMFDDLSRCLGNEENLAGALGKIVAMKEGLYQIKDLLVERGIGYKEARRQDCLVQKILSKNLASDHSAGGGHLITGKILASDDGRMVQGSLRQLDRALGVFKFVWETAGMKGELELQGHIWAVGAKDRSLMYRGNRFFVHAFRL